MCQNARNANVERLAYEDLQSKLGDKFKDKVEVDSEDEDTDEDNDKDLSVGEDESQPIDGINEDGELLDPDADEDEDDDEDDEDEEDEEDNEEDNENDETNDNDNGNDDNEAEEGDGTNTAASTPIKKRKKKIKKIPPPKEGIPNPSIIHPSFIGYYPRRPRDLFPTAPLNNSVPPVPRNALNVLSILNPTITPIERNPNEITPAMFGCVKIKS